MHKVIDTAQRVTNHLGALRAGGVKTIIRYYNHSNSSSLPDKRLEKTETEAIAASGMTLGVVFQQRGGARGHISDLDAGSGRSDARRALELADRMEQPHGSAIYFAVDHDYHIAAHLASIKAYFTAVRAELAGKYRIGVYGSGLVGKTVRDAGNADLIWLSMSSGWSGTRQMLPTTQWALRQIFPAKSTPPSHDGNTVSPAWSDFGQFALGGGTAAEVEGDGGAASGEPFLLMEVVARSGLNLRRGPGTHYAIEMTLAPGRIVQAVGTSGQWVNVDLDGDGQADGFVHSGYVRAASGGFPVSAAMVPPTPDTSDTPDTPDTPGTPGTPETSPTPGTPPTPPSAAFSALTATVPLASAYAVAQAELALDVREVPGSGNNPRVVMYHTTTNAWSGTDDAVAWCSSFVNYCVEQAGRVGTNSQRALDWEPWGQDVTNAPRTGDIVVFERVGKGGHVGFMVEDLGDHVSILGGNQSNRVRISTYPKDGVLGTTHYKLRSIRR